MAKVQKKKASPRKKTPAKKKQPVKKAVKRSHKYVLVPGGFRMIELISKARRKNGVHTVAFSEFLQTPTPASRARSRRLEQSLKLTEGFGPPSADMLNPNWVAYAAWKNTTGMPIRRFEATYTVPPLPPDDYQTIFLFIGLQNSTHILQPVLQYGLSAAGGGAFWSASSFFAGGQADKGQYSGMVTVSPGDSLTAVIEASSAGAGTMDYQCSFEGLGPTNLLAPGVPEMTFSCGTLESYHIAGPADYPSASFATIGGLAVSNDGGPIQVPWQLSGKPGKLGEHAKLDGSNQLELHFSNV